MIGHNQDRLIFILFTALVPNTDRIRQERGVIPGRELRPRDIGGGGVNCIRLGSWKNVAVLC